jgi:hypothetical protein
VSVSTSAAVWLAEYLFCERPAFLINDTANSWTQNSPYGSIYDLAAAMATSPELSIALQVDRYCQVALGRNPSSFELGSYVSMAEDGLTEQQIRTGQVSQTAWNSIAQVLFESSEYQSNFAATNTGLVQGLYQIVLGRTPAASETAYYVDQLANGYSVSTLLQEFANSSEYQSTHGTDATSLLVSAIAVAATGVPPSGGSISTGPRTGLFASAPSATEGSMVAFDLYEPYAAGTTVSYNVSGIPGEASGTVTIGTNGVAIIPVAIAAGTSLGLSGSLTVTVDGYSASVPLVESTFTPLAEAPGAYLISAGSTQSLGIGANASGSFDMAALGLTYAPIEITSNLTGNISFTSTGYSQVLSLDASQGLSLITLSPLPPAAWSSGYALTIHLDPHTNTGLSAAISAAAYTSLTVDSAGYPAANNLQLSDSSLTWLTIGGTAPLNLTCPGSAISNINASSFAGATLTLSSAAIGMAGSVIVSANDVNLTFIDTVAGANQTVNLSAGNGNNQIVVSGDPTANANIGLGNGKNSIDISACGGDSTVVVGTGNNTILLGAGKNYVGVGSGVDSISIAASASAQTLNIISGLQSGDSLTLFAKPLGNETWLNGSAQASQVTAASGQLADLIAAAHGASGTIAWFVYGGNEYVIENSATGYSMAELIGSTAPLSAASIFNHAVSFFALAL